MYIFSKQSCHWCYNTLLCEVLLKINKVLKVYPNKTFFMVFVLAAGVCFCEHVCLP